MRKYLMYGCISVIVFAMIALIIVTNTKKPLNATASTIDASFDTATVKIQNIDLYDANKLINGATFRITDITSNDSLDTKDITIVENGETYVDLKNGSYTIELISPAPDYASNNEIKNFTLSDSSVTPFDIVMKSESIKPLESQVVYNTTSSDLLPATSSNKSSIFVSDAPSKNPQTNDNFFKYSFFILIACGINFVLINTVFYLKKLR